MEGKITKIFNAADQIQAEMIHDHLKQNGIETMSKQPGTGEYMSIAMGYSVYGTDKGTLRHRFIEMFEISLILISTKP